MLSLEKEQNKQKEIREEIRKKRNQELKKRKEELKK